MPRKPKSKPPSDSQTEPPPNVPVNNPLSESPEEKEERERIARALLPLTPDERTRAIDRYDAWRNPSMAEKVCTAAQEKWLVAIGMVKDPAILPGTNHPIHVSSLDKLGVILKQKFPTGPDFTSQYLSQAHTRLAANPDRPKFPIRDGRNGYPVAENSEWIKKWVIDAGNMFNGGGAAGNPGSSHERKKLADAIIAEIEAENAKREHDQRWIMKDDAAMSVTGAVVALHGVWKRHLERLEKNLARDKFTIEQLAMIAESRIEVVKAIEDELQAYGES